MKKTLLLVIILLLTISFASCKRPSEVIGEAVAEKIIESTGGDVDIDGDEITIKGKEGEEITFGSTEWPDNDIAKAIPVFKSGTITSVYSSEGGVLIAIDEVKKEDYENYLEAVKKDFSEEVMESSTEGVHMYTAGNGKGELVTMYYDAEMKSLEISLEKASN